MRLGIGSGPAPALGGLEEFDVWATERGLIASRDYQWAWRDDDGTEWPGFWYVTLTKEQIIDEVIWVYNLSVSDYSVRLGRRVAWDHLAELLEAGFDRMIEESNDATVEELL